MDRLALSWSGGKDSSLTLVALRQAGREPCALVTTVTEGYDRVSMHGVRRALLVEQAACIGIPLVEVSIPHACANDVYEARMAEAFARPPLDGVEVVAFGDLFLEDIRSYREQRLAEAGKRAIFPLWGRNTRTVAHAFLDSGFTAVVVCVDPRALDPSLAGRRYDRQLLAHLPATVDPCGENGEFHTFVDDGPTFDRPVASALGQVVERDGFFYCDLVPCVCAESRRARALRS